MDKRENGERWDWTAIQGGSSLGGGAGSVDHGNSRFCSAHLKVLSRGRM